MVLRKPYRFLIKNFRIIHLVMLLLGSYLIYKTNNMLSFFNEYLESSSLISVYNLTSNLFNKLTFLVPILVLITLSSILYLLYWKKKPIKFYIFNAIIYIATLAIYIYIYTVCNTLETKVVDIRVLKLVDNLLLILLVLQVISTLFFFVRTLGFDVKKFNFKNDKDFEITDLDNEEFEFDVKFDSNEFKKSFNQKRRNLIYGYRENRFVADVLIGIVLLIIFLLIIRFVLIKFKHYQINQVFYSNNFSFQIKELYITDRDNKNNKITDNVLVVARVNVKGYKKGDKFNPYQLALSVNNIPYNVTTKYEKKLLDIGKTYRSQVLSTKDYTSYIITFEIPKKYKNRTKYIRFYNGNNLYKNIKVRPKSFKESKTDEVTLKKKLTIKNDLIDADLKINKIEINSKIKLYYKYKIKNITYNSYEYLVPSYNDNYEKTILMLDSSFKINKSNNIKKLFDLLHYTGSIEYHINGQTKIMKNINRQVKPKHINSSKICIEVNKEIEKADSIVLIFNIRNNNYRYKIK